jgi:hypothetical protein
MFRVKETTGAYTSEGFGDRERDYRIPLRLYSTLYSLGYQQRRKINRKKYLMWRKKRGIDGLGYALW